MTESTMRQIVTAAESDGLEVVAYEGYSGRGMYGETTCAVTASSLGAVLTAVCRAVQDSDDPDAIAEDLRGARTDSLGREMVIY